MLEQNVERWIEQYIQQGVAQGEVQGIQIGEARGIQIGEARGIQIGEARGIEIGKAQGFLNALFSCVRAGLLQLGDAAKQANMTEAEFRARMVEHETSQDP